MTQPPIDLAIVGVPKAGTTSLYTWLADHPGVQGSEPKETLYFMDRDSKSFIWADRPEAMLPTYDKDGWSGFEHFFPEPRNARLRLEASPSNLYHVAPLTALTSLRPQPLVIVALRCPAEQVRSAFYFSQNNGAGENFISIDTSLTFPAYVAALLEGDLEPLKDAIPNERLRWYFGEILHHNRYVEWLDAWAAHLAPEKLLPVRFEDLASRPLETLAVICERTGLDASFYDGYEFSRINPTLAQPHYAVRKLASAANRVVRPGRLHDILAGTYRGFLAKQHASPPSSDENDAMAALGDYFASSNQELSEKYGVDVSTWWPVRATT